MRLLRREREEGLFVDRGIATDPVIEAIVSQRRWRQSAVERAGGHSQSDVSDWVSMVVRSSLRVPFSAMNGTCAFSCDYPGTAVDADGTFLPSDPACVNDEPVPTNPNPGGGYPYIAEEDRNGDGVVYGYERCGLACGQELTSGDLQIQSGCEAGHVTGPLNGPMMDASVSTLIVISSTAGRGLESLMAHKNDRLSSGDVG